MKSTTFILLAAAIVLGGCATVDVTKTSKGFTAATDPNAVQILKTIPAKPYDELGSVTVTGFAASDVAKMHNAVRSKAAPLGADAVILVDEGITPSTFSSTRWATGVAIAFKK